MDQRRPRLRYLFKTEPVRGSGLRQPSPGATAGNLHTHRRHPGYYSKVIFERHNAAHTRHDPLIKVLH